MPATDKLPCDAVKVENVARKKQGATKYERTDSVLNLIEPMLGLDRAAGRTGHIRVQPGGTIFVTGNPRDMLRYGAADPLGRTGERYNWVRSEADPDIILGYLKDKPAEPEAPAGTSVTITPATLEGDGTMKGGA